MIEDGAQILEPSTLDALAGDPAMKGAFAFLVHLEVREKVQRYNITARRSQMEEIDRLAIEKGMTRSAFIVASALASAAARPTKGRSSRNR
jgi:hypothetical protein